MELWPGARFGSLKWAVSKAVAGYARGPSLANYDCHTRGGYAARILGPSLGPDAELRIFAAPSGDVAHTALWTGDGYVFEPKDRVLMERIGDYALKRAIPVAVFAAFARTEVEIRPDPFDGAVAAVAGPAGSAATALAFVSSRLDELVLAAARGGDGCFGFDPADRRERALASTLAEAGFTETARTDGPFLRIRLNDEGRDALVLHYATALAAGRATTAEVEARLAVLAGTAVPCDPTAPDALSSRRWAASDGTRGERRTVVPRLLPDDPRAAADFLFEMVAAADADADTVPTPRAA